MLNLVANGPSGYTINNSLRFRSSASAYLSRTPGSAGNRTVWTWSGWVKLGALGANPFFAADSSASAYEYIRVNSSYQLNWGIYSSGTIGSFTTNAVFRDPSAWYHVIVTRNGTTSACYVNGVSQSFASNTTTSSNGYINATNRHTVGADIQDAYYYDGYMAEVNFIDGQALTPSSFGSTNSTTGVWQPAKYTGTYGTNGFYLNFNNIALTSGSNTGLGKDNSGNGNYWNTNNISVTAGTTYDAMTDVPTLTSATVANYAVLNPLGYTGVFTFADGNLKVTGTSSGNNVQAQGTIFVNSGKWYWEITDLAGGAGSCIGISDVSVSTTTAVGTSALSYGYLASSGNKINNSSSVAYGATFTANDVIGVALDLSAGTLTFYKNGTSQGTAYTGLSGTFSAAVSDSSASSTPSYAANFGQQPFTYSVPSGFVALNTYNLPTSTIVKGNTVMDATLYTGTGSSLAITNTAGFKPDLVWMKSRSAATDHALFDSVRGTTLELISDSTAAETTQSTGLTAFNTNGWTIGAEAKLNTSAATYVGWQWQAGQGSSSSNTNGSITSTVSVNASAGFSVVTYTGNGTAGATIGHGLGVAPAMIIFKDRDSVTNWCTYHKSLGNATAINLNQSNASFASASFNSTTPTSTLITLNGTGYDVNNSTKKMLAYCWAAIPGFSAFGSYTGNGSTDGPFIFTNFQPKFVMVKRTDSSTGADWFMWDSARLGYNVSNYLLFADASQAEYSGHESKVDLLSNGFKIRDDSTAPGSNASGGTYVYACFASNPFKNSLAR